MTSLLFRLSTQTETFLMFLLTAGHKNRKDHFFAMSFNMPVQCVTRSEIYLCIYSSSDTKRKDITQKQFLSTRGKSCTMAVITCNEDQGHSFINNDLIWCQLILMKFWCVFQMKALQMLFWCLPMMLAELLVSEDIFSVAFFCCFCSWAASCRFD